MAIAWVNSYSDMSCKGAVHKKGDKLLPGKERGRLLVGRNYSFVLSFCLVTAECMHAFMHRARDISRGTKTIVVGEHRFELSNYDNSL